MSSTQVFDDLWQQALDKYIDSTGRTEREQALLKQLKTPDDLETELAKERDRFETFRAKHGRLTGRLKKAVRPLTVLSGIASSAISLSPFAPASTIFGAVVFVVKAADGVSEAYDWIDQLFDKLGDFTIRLDEYCNSGIGPHLGAKVVQILECLLEILARSEKKIKTGRWKTLAAVIFLGKDEEIKASFDKLAKLFDDEQRLVTAITFATNQRMDKRVEEIEKIGKDTLGAAKRIEGGVEDQRRDKILNWIYPINVLGKQQSDVISRRQEGTGSWFLDTPKFNEWIHGASQTLFCPGMPGAGKTIMAAVAIDYLTERMRDNASGVAYIFCEYKRQVEQNATALLAAILRQLVPTRGAIPEPVLRLHEKHCERGTSPSLEEIFNTLQYILKYYSKLYVVIDALDECSDDDRAKLLDKIRALQRNPSANICLMATSRYIPAIENAFKGEPKLDVQASDHDVKRFIASQIGRMPEFVKINEELRTRVQDTITQAVAGM